MDLGRGGESLVDLNPESEDLERPDLWIIMEPIELAISERQ